MRSCIVAATGTSLNQDIAEQCRGKRVIAVNDAYRLFPYAEKLYACDADWWRLHNGCPEFSGEKWTSNGAVEKGKGKVELAKLYGLNVVEGKEGNEFSFDPSFIHYGENSGFQAINLAIYLGATLVVLVGFDMRGDKHFFGVHPPPLRYCRFERFIPIFAKAAAKLPGHIRIWNATPGSALECFPMKTLAECLPEIEDV